MGVAIRLPNGTNYLFPAAHTRVFPATGDGYGP